MRPQLRIFVLVLPLLGMTRSALPAPAHWPQDAYVWQRLWTSALAASLNSSSDLIADWRVLVAETGGDGQLKAVALNWPALRMTGKPVIAVIRIDGTLARLNEDLLLAQIRDLALRWKQTQIAGLEIDYDCATSRLADYAQFLRRLRSLPGLPRRLSVTALPSWIGSAHLSELSGAADEIVLQVHAVRAPRFALFNAAEARTWIDAFDRITTKPFRIALPDYAVRTVWNKTGDLLAIESETPRLAGGTYVRELVAEPRAVARLLDALAYSPPRHLAGIVWFRLPTDDDSFTWGLATWRAVARGDLLQDSLAIVSPPASTPGLRNIVIVDTGTIDSELPRSIVLPAGCRVADGVNGYALDMGGGEIVLQRLQNALLRAHHHQTIGWMRCGQGAFDVRP
ncbi:MAG TPA: DUF3142 domain-containing protein [Rhizomicrobium sp.]|nr:DUF3142 domain-containing protein [Rhizomicrobium sp.]